MHDSLLFAERILGRALVGAEIMVIYVANRKTKMCFVLLFSQLNFYFIFWAAMLRKRLATTI